MQRGWSLIPSSFSRCWWFACKDTIRLCGSRQGSGLFKALSILSTSCLPLKAIGKLRNCSHVTPCLCTKDRSSRVLSSRLYQMDPGTSTSDVAWVNNEFVPCTVGSTLTQESRLKDWLLVASAMRLKIMNVGSRLRRDYPQVAGMNDYFSVPGTPGASLSAHSISAQFSTSPRSWRLVRLLSQCLLKRSNAQVKPRGRMQSFLEF